MPSKLHQTLTMRSTHASVSDVASSAVVLDDDEGSTASDISQSKRIVLVSHVCHRSLRQLLANSSGVFSQAGTTNACGWNTASSEMPHIVSVAVGFGRAISLWEV